MDPTLFDGSLVKSNRIIYTPSDFAKANLLHLQEVGSLQAHKPHSSSRSNLHSYLFFIVLDGAGTLEYGGETYALGKGSCVFIDCRKPYQHRSSERLWRLKWVHFYGPNMVGIYEKYVERGGTPAFSVKDSTKWEQILTRLYDIASSDNYVKDMLICETLTGLLTLLMERSWNPGEHKERSENGRKRRDLQALKEWLDEHYREPIRLEQLADRFYINKYYLTRVFKEQYGVSISGYLLQVRITHAKQLLRFTDETMEQIAASCGFADANYFARQFRKVEGVSPAEYRKTW